MDHTHIIKASDLERYADTRDSQALIPELIYHLVSQSSGANSVRRIPYGDAVNQPGLDGLVISKEGFQGLVPEGSSFWEIGVGTDPQKKATKDFAKRTKQTSESDRNQTSFVFVTPRCAGTGGWDETKQTNWLNSRRSKGWKSISIIDGVKLADWLRVYPAIGRWLANKMGITPSLGGLFTPKEHWELILGQTDSSDPPLPPAVFTVGGKNVCEALQSLFDGTSKRLLIFVESPQDVQDFVAAYLAGLDEAVGNAYANRCLFIAEEDAWRSVVDSRQAHVLVADTRLALDSEGADLQTLATRNGHAVVIPLCGAWSDGSPEIIKLRSPSQQQIETALREAGFSETRSRELARIGGDRVSALRRHLLGLGTIPPYGSWENARLLAQAGLIGRWDGKSPGDIDAIEVLLGKGYGEWIEKLRPDAIRSDSPLTQNSEKWRMVARGEAWDALGNRINDDDLKRFQDFAVAVLSERDPQFDLPKEERYLAGIKDKKLTHSRSLRKGVAESLALMGARPKALSQCSNGAAVNTAFLTVRQLLENADWDRWASLGSLLILLAEAAPDEFLDAVEAALEDLETTPFLKLFDEEGGGIIGGGENHSGLLWALETLAWNPSFLSRVSMILADLAAIDPGGRVSNRPANSLADIFLPWHIQTTAAFSYRKAAIESILREQPEVGWTLLLALLPHSHGMTTGCHRPTWREYIPRDWKTGGTVAEYWQQISELTEIAVSNAIRDTQRMAELIDRLPDLEKSAHESILSHLVASDTMALSEEDRFQIWQKLDALVRRHRKYSDCEWALREEAVIEIEKAATLLAPKSPMIVYRYLFDGRDFDLYDDKGDYDTQRKKLDKSRQEAIKILLRSGGIDSIWEFSQSVSAPYEVGRALGIIASKKDELKILPSFLEESDSVRDQFVSGFVWARFWEKGWDWVDLLLRKRWSAKAKAALLVRLPFTEEAWKRAEMALGEKNERAYWVNASVNPYGPKRDLSMGIEKLILYGRPGFAVHCVERTVHEDGMFDARLAIKALMATLETPESIKGLNQHDTTSVIERLQSDETSDKDMLFIIEWNFLPWLDRFSSGSPKTLEKRLASDPSFFAEVVGHVFRSDNDKPSEAEPDERTQNLAQNGYKLLSVWRRCPGLLDDGTFSAAAFDAWMDNALKICKSTGHLGVAQSHIGQILTNAPPDPMGLWIHETVASALNAKNAGSMRSGFTIQLFNNRGVHGFSAGEEEKELAQINHEKADALDLKGFTRFATAMREFAERYDRDSKRESTRDPYRM